MSRRLLEQQSACRSGSRPIIAASVGSAPGPSPSMTTARQVVEEDHALGDPERVVVGDADDAGAQPDVPGALRGGRDEDLRRGDDLAAGGVVLADPGLVVAEPVEVRDQLEVALERQGRVVAGRMERRQEHPEAQPAHAVSPRRRRRTIDGRRLLDEDLRADGDPRVQVLDVGDVHPDAAVRRARADRPVLGGAVDADAVGDPEPARLERVVRRPAGDDLALEAAGPRGVRDVPGRVDLLVGDRVDARRRVVAGLADGDRVRTSRTSGS